MTSDVEKQQASSSNPGDQVYEVVWSYNLWFGLSPAYKVFILSGTMALTSDLDKQ
jgi:hypothetical protein